jgi:hypothetical protein
VKLLNDKINLKELEQKTYNEFLIDGIPEIFTGLILVFMPLFLLNPIFVAFMVFYLFLGPHIFEYIRQRTTYPRIGRVEFREDESRENYSVKRTALEFLIFLSVVILVTFTVMFVFEGTILEISLWYSWVPFTFGLIMFGPSAFLVEKTGRRYYYVFWLFSSFLGFAISLLNFPDIWDGMFLYFFMLGILVMILGIMKYFWFIRNYPIIELEEE